MSHRESETRFVDYVLAAAPPPPPPPDHPSHLAWPPKWRSYPQHSPARQTRTTLDTPFNEDWAHQDFGNKFIRELMAQQARFRGDWWLLALLIRCTQSATARDRFAWWNTHYRRTFVGYDSPYALSNNNNLDSASIAISMAMHQAFTQCAILARLDFADLSELHLQRINLSNSHLPHADLSGSMLEYADLSRANLTHANLARTTLKRANLTDARLASANLTFSYLRQTYMYRADISSARIGGANFIRTYGLFGRERAITTSEEIKESESQCAIYCWGVGWYWSERRRGLIRPLLKDFPSWEHLRIIGTLRLFAVSYFTVISIILYVSFAQWFNPIAARAYETSKSLAIAAERPVPFWAAVLTRLKYPPEIPVPNHLGRQFVATILLAMAATIFAIVCPAEIKEATEVRWTRAMNQPLWEYRSANWCRLLFRYLCASLFMTGGAYTGYYLADRSIEAAQYLLGSS